MKQLKVIMYMNLSKICLYNEQGRWICKSNFLLSSRKDININIERHSNIIETLINSTYILHVPFEKA